MRVVDSVLMKHQEEGVEFLIERKTALLAFEQGLGKTAVAICAFARLKSSGIAERLLVVCPNSLKRNWVAEVGSFAPQLSVDIIEGNAHTRRRRLSQSNADVCVMSFETARSEMISVQAVLRRRRFVLVIDESHYVKNRESLTSIAAQYFAPLAVWRWLLSGTPVTNAPVDLFAQLSILGAGKQFTSHAAFTSAFGDLTSERDQRALAAAAAPFMLRRTKAECLDLPGKTFVDLRVELPHWQRTLYDRLRDDAVAEVAHMSEVEFQTFAPTALTRLLRLSQIASNPSLVFPTEGRVPGKVLELDRLLTEILENAEHKVILWCYYVKSIKDLLARYQSYGALAMFGETPLEERDAIARRFQSDAKARLLIANPAAAGTGFTFTAATYAIYESLNWRFDHYVQSQDRNHRIGQTRPVSYIRLLAAETVESVIAESLSRKAVMASVIMGDTHAAVSSAELTLAEYISALKESS